MAYLRADTRRTIHTWRKRYDWHATTFVLIAVGVIAALWQVVNGTGWVR